MNKKLYIFFHIAKCAGTYLRAAIIDNFSKPCFSKDIYQKIPKIGSYFDNGKKFKYTPEIIGNHLPFGIHKVFHIRDYAYFTILREPVPRCISGIHHFYGHEIDVEWVLNEHMKYYINCNTMTRQFSGAEKMSNIMNVAKDERHKGSFYCNTNRYKYKYSHNDMKELLRLAKQNLDKMDYVGFQQTAAKNTKEICKKYGWTFTDNTKFRSKTKQRKEWKDDAIIKRIADMNKYDIEFYDYAMSKYFKG